MIVILKGEKYKKQLPLGTIFQLIVPVQHLQMLTDIQNECHFPDEIAKLEVGKMDTIYRVTNNILWMCKRYGNQL